MTLPKDSRLEVVETRTYTVQDGAVFSKIRDAEQYVETLRLEATLGELGWTLTELSTLAHFLIHNKDDLIRCFDRLATSTSPEVAKALALRRHPPEREID